MRIYQSSEQQRMGNVGGKEQEGGPLKICGWSLSQLSQGDVAFLKQRPVDGDHQ